jgi:cobaltochelatase CobN
MVLEGRDTDDVLRALDLKADGGQRKRMERHRDEVIRISGDIDGSDEIGSLLNGLGGGHIRPGPSGDMTRGRPDILPTGRNFYALNPDTMPTETAFRTGTILAEQTVRRYLDDTGTMPETVGIYWMCSDILMADGEVLGQIMSLIGIQPIYGGNGLVNDYAIVPLEKLNHPRIDITARVSGILRDNFMSRVDLLDRAIREIVELDEPIEMNFLRKHYLESISEGADEEEATARFFSAPPGAYSSGVKLAVFASAWKTEKDLSDVYITANGYAYGGSRNGKAMHEQFASNLSKVDITYNKIASDEHDLLGC